MDNTYFELLKYINFTQEIATCALQQLDSNAEFHIIGSFDMGIPYDVDRLAGGFPTGVYVYWYCKEPIIPVDATVNCCSVSIFNLGKFPAFDQCKFIHRLKELNELWEKGSYDLNFNRGNHFISLCVDEEKTYFLVMHSTAKEFTKCYNGLYPINGNWYYDKIKVFQKEQRYFRYIKGQEAVLFANTAKSLNKYNEIRHENIAYSLLNVFNTNIVGTKHFHHYGMDDNNTIKIGCYTVNEGSVFPILSKPSYPIDIYKILNCTNKTPKGEFIVPHGWGKTYLFPLQIQCNYDNKTLNVDDMSFNLFSNDNLYRLNGLTYRDFKTKGGINNFYDYFNSELKGGIVKHLSQVICMSSMGIEKYDLEI